MQQIGEWLEKLGLSEYAQRFADDAIDLSVIRDLTEQDLKDLGVLLGHRRKILRAIAELDGVAPAPIETATEPMLRGEAERRHLTVMICDLVGSTALSARLDPEDMGTVIDAYHAACARIMRTYDGFVAEFRGDGILAYFGYPRAHEDDAERTVRAGLDIIAAVAALKTRAAEPLAVRIGIATGLVIVGNLSSEGALRTHGVVGDTPNLAGRLQGIAEPNMIVIAESTRRLLGNLFELEDLGIRNLKGIAAPVRSWAVLQASSVPSRFEALHATGLTAFVGREEEFELLRRCWFKAAERKGQVVLVSGEAGIGKSRLTTAFPELLAGERHIRLRYFCSPQHTDSALYPIIGQMERAAGLARDDPAQTKLDKLDALLNQTSTNAQDAALFAEVLSLPNDGRYPAIELSSQQRRQRTLQALVLQMGTLARSCPVLMIFEDAQWSDPTSLELLGRAVDRIRKLSALLIVTFRPEFQPGWIGQPHVTPLSLNRLAAREVGAMIDHIVSNKALPANMRQDIIERTDGIPLFVEEMTKAVLEAGGEGEARRAVASVPSPALAVPASLHASLMARLDRLGPAKELAQVGAAIGREFSFGLLAAVSSMRSADLRDALAKLEAAELVFSQGTPPNTSYIFKHALVQDAAYETLLKSRRQQLHARIAGVLESRFSEIAETQPEIVAHHYTNAGLAQVAVEWWRKAGDIAIKRSANLEAVRHLDRAVEQVQFCPEGRERDMNELAIRIRLSGPLIATRGYVTSELANNYARASELCTKLGEDKSTFPVMYGQWVIPYVRGDMAAALRNSEMFLRRAEQQDDVGLLMMGHRIYGSSLVWRGDVLPGAQHLKHALSMFQSPAHDRLAYVFSQHPRTAALAHLCLALQHLGHLDEAMAAGWEAISQAKRIEHFNSIAYALCFVSLLIMLRRDVKTLKRTAGELLQLAGEHNASYWLLWAKPMMGWIAAQEGQTEAGIAQMHESTTELQRQQANLWVPQTLLLEAEILGKAKEYPRAYRLLNEAQALIEPLDQRFYEAELHRVRGVVMISDGADLAGGAARIDRAIEVARHQNARFLELRAIVSKARFLIDRGLREDAHNLLAPVYASFSEGLDLFDLREARSLLDELKAHESSTRA